MRTHHGPPKGPSAEEILGAYTNRGAASPSAAQTQAYGRFVHQLVEMKVWHKFDLLYLLGAADQTMAKINMANPGFFTLTEANAPTWAADRGYTFNGTNQECTTGWAPSRNGVAMLRASMHVMAYTLTAGTTTGYDFGETTGTLIGARVRTGTNGAVRVSEAGGLAGDAGGTQPIQIIGNRPLDSANRQIIRDGVQRATGAAASNALSANTFGVGRAISLFSDRQIFMVSCGAGFSPDEILPFYTACNALAVALGADT